MAVSHLPQTKMIKIRWVYNFILSILIGGKFEHPIREFKKQAYIYAKMSLLDRSLELW